MARNVFVSIYRRCRWFFFVLWNTILTQSGRFISISRQHNDCEIVDKIDLLIAKQGLYSSSIQRLFFLLVDDNFDWIRVIHFQIETTHWLLISSTRFVDFRIKECIHQQYRPWGLFFFVLWTTILTESKWLVSASRRDMTCQNKECFHQYLTWVAGLSLCSGRWFRGNWSNSFQYQDDTLIVRLKTRFVDCQQKECFLQYHLCGSLRWHWTYYIETNCIPNTVNHRVRTVWRLLVSLLSSPFDIAPTVEGRFGPSSRIVHTRVPSLATAFFPQNELQLC
jgi:hypothetical protein